MEYSLRHWGSHCLPLFEIEKDIQTLEMMKVAYLLVQRNAATEQRKGRANDCNCTPDTTIGITHAGDCIWWQCG